MAEALAMAKREFGPDALILRTRSVRAGGVAGFGGRQVVEVIAAAPEDPTPEPPSRHDRLRKAYTAVPLTDQPTEPVQIKAEPAPIRVSSDVGEGRSTASGIEAELGSLKRLVSQVLLTTREASLRGADPLSAVRGHRDELVGHYLRLLEADVGADIADEVIAAVRDSLRPEELTDGPRVREAVRQRLASLIPTSETGALDLPAIDRGGGGGGGRGGRGDRPYVISLIGPTGVGKTTTLAKLAAGYTLRHGKSVGVIAGDTLRLGAVDQLRLYATIIGVPIRVCASPRDVRAAMESLAACDIVLMDTAGCPPRDFSAMEELRAILAAADPDETHLVLAATSSRTTLVEAGKQFATAGPDRLLLTKLDEAANFGVLLSAARAIDLRLSYLTTGQDVPDHLEVGRGDRLASLILGEHLSATSA